MPQFIVYNEISRQEKLFTFLVVFMAFANVYRLPIIPLGIGEILLFLFIPFYCKKGINVSMQGNEKIFVLWFAYVTVISLFFINYFDAPISKLFSVARPLFYGVIIFVFGKNLFNQEYFKKWMLLFGIALSSYIILQFVVYLVTGFFMPGFVLNAPLNDGDVIGAQLYEHYLVQAGYRGFIRPNGFLCEPAQCSQFLFVCIVCLFSDRKVAFMRKIIYASLFSLSVFFTLSTTGIVLLFFAWFVYMTIEKRLSVFRIPLILFGLIFTVILMGGFVESGYKSIDRIIAVINGDNIDDSSNIRLYNGFNVFSSLPLSLKLFGTGIGLFDYVSNVTELNSTVKYMSAFSGIFFMSGIVGAVAWNAALFVMFLNSNLLGKFLVSGFFLMCFGGSLFCQPQMVWIFLLVLSDIKKEPGIAVKKCT